MPTTVMDKQQWISLSIIMFLALIVFFPSFRYDFVNWDDVTIVIENTIVHKGLSGEMVQEAFTTPHVRGQYYPLTLLTFATNHAISELEPWSYHVMNLLFHLLNIALLFVILGRLFRKSWLVGFITLMFAIHPMHVEPVVWISSRKDVLYLFFMLIAWWSYLRYLEDGKKKVLFFGLSILLMGLSAMSKSAAIVFPFVLLLTDYLKGRKDLKRILLEKAPFFVITMVFVWIGIEAQKAGEAVGTVTGGSGIDSLFYGSAAFLIYLFKAVIPVRLAAYHPYPGAQIGAIPWYIYAAPMGALAVLGLAIWKGRKNREFVFGAGLFLCSIFPFLQFLPVGPSLTAERFTYFPYVGLFILMGMGLEWIGGKFPKLMKHDTRWKLFLLGLSLPFLAVSILQAGTWKNGETLWSKVIRVHPTAPTGYMNRAQYYKEQNEIAKGLEDYNTCIEKVPNFTDAYNNRGMVFMGQKNYPQALADFGKAIELNPNNAIALSNRGLIYMNSGKYPEALADFDRSIELKPNNVENQYNRGFLMGIMGRYKEAIGNFDAAAALNPSLPIIYKDRAMAYHLLKDMENAVADYSKALELNPNYGESWIGRSRVWYDAGDLEKARSDLNRALELGIRTDPEYLQALGM